jgi:hypothetical protein
VSVCDSCGRGAPDVVRPILLGYYRWGEFNIDGEHEGREWRADVLLCPTCAPRMTAFVASGGIAGRGPKPPVIQTCRGGQRQEPDFAAVVPPSESRASKDRP